MVSSPCSAQAPLVSASDNRERLWAKMDELDQTLHQRNVELERALAETRRLTNEINEKQRVREAARGGWPGTPRSAVDSTVAAELQKVDAELKKVDAERRVLQDENDALRKKCDENVPPPSADRKPLSLEQRSLLKKKKDVMEVNRPKMDALFKKRDELQEVRRVAKGGKPKGEGSTAPLLTQGKGATGGAKGKGGAAEAAAAAATEAAAVFKTDLDKLFKERGDSFEKRDEARKAKDGIMDQKTVLKTEIDGIKVIEDKIYHQQRGVENLAWHAKTAEERAEEDAWWYKLSEEEQQEWRSGKDNERALKKAQKEKLRVEKNRTRYETRNERDAEIDQIRKLYAAFPAQKGKGKAGKA